MIRTMMCAAVFATVTIGCAVDQRDAAADKARADEIARQTQAGELGAPELSMSRMDLSQMPPDVLVGAVNLPPGNTELANGCRIYDGGNCGTCSWWPPGDVPHGCSWCGDYWTCH